MKDDSIDGIYDTLKQCALISKSAGGIGLAVSCIRSTGSYIAGVSKTQTVMEELSFTKCCSLSYITCFLFFRRMAPPMGWFPCFGCTITQHVTLTRAATR